MLIPFLKEPFLRLTHLTAFVAGLYANFQLKKSFRLYKGSCSRNVLSNFILYIYTFDPVLVNHEEGYVRH